MCFFKLAGFNVHFRWSVSENLARKKEINYYTVNLFNTDTKGTEPSVRFTEVSVL